MKESDYIKAVTLARLRIVDDLLRQCLMGSVAPAMKLPVKNVESSYTHVVGIIDAWIRLLEKAV